MSILCIDLAKTSGIVVASEKYKPMLITKITMENTHLSTSLFTAIISEFNIKIVYFEQVQFSRSRFAVERYAELRQGLEKACFDAGIDCIGVGVGEIKKALTGLGNANKKQMVACANLKYDLDLTEKDNDKADALGLLAWVESEYG